MLIWIRLTGVLAAHFCEWREAPLSVLSPRLVRAGASFILFHSNISSAIGSCGSHLVAQRPRIVRQWMRRSRLQFVKYCVANALRMAAKVRVPKPECFDPTRSENSIALHIAFLLAGIAMLRAVQFNRQARLFTEKINAILADGMLSTKLITRETMVPEPRPH